MDFIQIDAQPRTDTGSSSSSQLRRSGQIPAIAYGRGAPSRSLAVAPKQLLSAMQGPYGRNAVMQIKVGEEQTFPALVCDYTYHPVTRSITHVDFLHIDLNVPVDVDVPLIANGKAAGVVTGGVLRQVYRTLPVRCLPEKIPVKLEHDVTPLAQGESAKTSDIQVPEGVTIRLPAEQTIIAIVAPETEKVEEGVPGAVVEGAAVAAAPADGKAAAPADAKAAAAAPKAAAASKAAAPEKKEKK